MFLTNFVYQLITLNIMTFLFFVNTFDNEVDENRLFFTKIKKTGTLTMNKLIKESGPRNNFCKRPFYNGSPNIKSDEEKV